MKKITIGLILALAAIAAGCTTDTSRNLNDATVPGKVLVQQVCSNCHGVDGNSTNPTFPKLAGQQPEYIVAELKEFRSHDRSDPAGYEYMWGIARHLTDTQIDQIATYFSAQTNIPDPSVNVALEAQGRDIFNNGISIAPEAVPACASCHGAQGAGHDMFPRIAGQHADYIAKQINVFKNTLQRPDGVLMKAITHDLTPEQINAVAAYLARKS